MQYTFVTGFTIVRGSEANIVDYAARPVTSPRLNRLRAAGKEFRDFKGEDGEKKTIADKVRQKFNFGESKKKTEVTAESMDDVTDESLNIDEDFKKEDYEMFANAAVGGADWLMAKGLHHFSDKKLPENSSPSVARAEKRFKSLLATCFQRWGMKFKIEFLLIIYGLMFLFLRFKSAIPEDQEEKKKVKAKTGGFTKTETKSETKKEEKVKQTKMKVVAAADIINE